MTGERETREGGGMPLCSPEDILEDADNDGFIFYAPPRHIPDVGDISLEGIDMGAELASETGGMAFTGNGLVIGSSAEFASRGLHKLLIRLERTGRPLSLACQLTVPEFGLNVESPFEFDEDTNQQDPMIRYTGITGEWRTPSQKEPYTIFVPKDTQVLSLPLFRIRFLTVGNGEGFGNY